MIVGAIIAGLLIISLLLETIASPPKTDERLSNPTSPLRRVDASLRQNGPPALPQIVRVRPQYFRRLLLP